MRGFIQIIVGLITALFILSSAAVLTLNAGFLYDWDIETYHMEEYTGLTREEIKANYQAMVDYNNLGGPDTLEFPTFSMSEGGRIHFEDVRGVFYAIEIGAIVTGFITLVGIVLSIRKKLIEYRLWAGVFTLALPAAAGVFAAVDWYGLFVFFHKLVFNNDYWLFDELTDPVITILPDGYFLHCLIMIVVIALGGAAAFLVWYFKGQRALLRTE